LTGYKRPAVSMKSKKRPSRKPEDWEVIMNTHEGIVSQKDFDLVQSLMTSRRREKGTGFDNVLVGVIKCADCNYAMRANSAHRRKRPDIIDCVQYSCNNYGRYGNESCTAHSIEARDLINTVITEINYFAEMAHSDEKMVQKLQNRLNSNKNIDIKANQQEHRKLKKRISELDKLFASLYEDKVIGNITERNFSLMSRKYETEQLELDQQLSNIETQLTQKVEEDNGVRDFVELIKGFNGISELTAPIVQTLIDKITICEKTMNSDAKTVQRIQIYYKFVGEIS
jgi:site-specific DNA recombinase